MAEARRAVVVERVVERRTFAVLQRTWPTDLLLRLVAVALVATAWVQTRLEMEVRQLVPRAQPPAQETRVEAEVRRARVVPLVPEASTAQQVRSERVVRVRSAREAVTVVVVVVVTTAAAVVVALTRRDRPVVVEVVAPD